MQSHASRFTNFADTTEGLGGGMLWSIVRSIIGSAAGFNGGGGIMRGIIRAVFMRYGWSILSTIPRRAILGR